MEGWLAAFLFTELVESPLYFLALRRSEGGTIYKIVAALGPSALTHPVVWFVAPPLVGAWCPYQADVCFWIALIASEAFAILVEWVYLAALGVRRAWMWTLVANVASAGLGWLLRWLVGWP